MKIPHPKVLHIVGSKNSGKTTLIRFLIRELSSRRIKVAALKHSSHQHPLDKPGSDSQRFAESFRQAGASPVIFANPDGFAVFSYGISLASEEEFIKKALKDVDIVLVESFRSAAGKKILVLDDKDFPDDSEEVIAVVGNKTKPMRHPIFSPNDLGLVQFVLDACLKFCRGSFPYLAFHLTFPFKSFKFFSSFISIGLF